jgi:hypothetical protein
VRDPARPANAGGAAEVGPPATLGNRARACNAATFLQRPPALRKRLRKNRTVPGSGQTCDLRPRKRSVTPDTRVGTLAAAAEALRPILVETTRREQSLKHGGGHRPALTTRRDMRIVCGRL